MTQDKWVLDCVDGMTIPFIIPPVQNWVPRPFKMSVEENKFVNNEVHNLLDKQVLKLVQLVDDQWISNIFLRPKPNGKFRMILELTLFLHIRKIRDCIW